MAKKISPQQNDSNIKNSNKGTSGTNAQNAKVNGNKGKQMNPNHVKSKN